MGTQSGVSPTRSTPARRDAARASSHTAHSGTGGSAASVSSASCSSSGSRTTGHDSSATVAMAAGSRAPMPPGSLPSERRNCTARARRSSSGASSRNA